MHNTITLDNLKGGAVLERFEDELRRVAENVIDPNCEAKVKREIILRIVIKPDAERRIAAVGIYASSKLAPPLTLATVAYFGKDGGRAVAFEHDPQQLTLDNFIEPLPQHGNVTKLQKAEEASK
jgi:hypothetical protein